MRPYINDHHDIFSIMNTVPITNNSNIVTKRILNQKYFAHFNNQTWDIVYNQDTIQHAFPAFQRVIEMHFNDCFPKQTV